jgi:hypothetical protein
MNHFGAWSYHVIEETLRYSSFSYEHFRFWSDLVIRVDKIINFIFGCLFGVIDLITWWLICEALFLIRSSQVFKVSISLIRIVLVEKIVIRLNCKLICAALNRFFICITEISIQIIILAKFRITWISSHLWYRGLFTFAFLLTTFIIIGHFGLSRFRSRRFI